jgi:hypothetical protein
VRDATTPLPHTHSRHPEGERDEVARASRRMAARTELAATLRDAALRAALRVTTVGTLV